MEEEERQPGEELKENIELDSERIEERTKNFINTIDLGKATIVVFMLAAALCALVGFYFGVQYATNECNSQYGEFFSQHCCIKGNCVNPVQGYRDFNLVDIGDIDDS